MDKDTPSARFTKKSAKFFEKCSHRAAANGHAIDVFACSFDQTGLHEMRALANSTGYPVVRVGCQMT